MAYTTINKSSDHFNTVTYTGNSTDNRTVTGVGFQPDWTWIKLRNSVSQHELFDAVRGANKPISSNLTTAESTETNRLKSFDSDGFTLGTGTAVNGGYTFASWNWKASGTSGSANTDGAINSTVSANTTAGFSIVTHTGTGSTATIGHGLGAVPKVIITKKRSAADNWFTYHHSIGNGKYLLLEATDAEATSSNVWNDTSPTSSVFTRGGPANDSGATYVAYCFAEKTGFSKFGSYTGNANASNAPFIYTGFKPAFVLHKRTDSTSDWDLFDNKRVGYNVDNRILAPNTNAAEVTATKIDLLSNGFKLRTSTGGNYSGTYIYMAFAEAPLVGSNNVPCTAR
jgi:hypothetical protein